MHTMIYRSPQPYPEIRVERKNPRYAREMLANMGGPNSEMSAVSLYFYNHLVLREDPQLYNLFHQVSMVEMHHLEIFGNLAALLGADPRLWSRRDRSMRYWNAGYNKYPREPRRLLYHALHEEMATIERYNRQIQYISDPYIVENLHRILVDEQLHVDLFRSALEWQTRPEN